jgi:hypothetical protein
MSNPVIIIKTALEDGELLFECAICDNEILVNHDYRETKYPKTSGRRRDSAK